MNQIAILSRRNIAAEIINKNLTSPHRLLISTELDINLNIWSAIFSSLLYFVFDKTFKFIDAIEPFTSYDRLSKKELQTLKIHKSNIEKISVQTQIDLNALKNEFINVATVVAPNSESNESILLLEYVLNNSTELDSYKTISENEINILTIHKSKGLEYDFIIHLDLYEWVLPNKQPGPNNDFNNPLYGDWNQDLNLHYVGLTRARKGCLLVTSTQRTNNEYKLKQGKDSEFLWLNGIEKLRHKKADKSTG